jgi:hypothetical protein
MNTPTCPPAYADPQAKAAAATDSVTKLFRRITTISSLDFDRRRLRAEHLQETVARRLAHDSAH